MRVGFGKLDSMSFKDLYEAVDRDRKGLDWKAQCDEEELFVHVTHPPPQTAQKNFPLGQRADASLSEEHKRPRDQETLLSVQPRLSKHCDMLEV
ncbi:unnamed protein product [Leuciscus chuanchicus]